MSHSVFHADDAAIRGQKRLTFNHLSLISLIFVPYPALINLMKTLTLLLINEVFSRKQLQLFMRIIYQGDKGLCSPPYSIVGAREGAPLWWMTFVLIIFTHRRTNRFKIVYKAY